ncbi:Methyltransferase domain-containing protein [Singulisphaera sp. GP187]|uniref:class I SAM-dependent methyltransferase n=1 Tax=Singulisphaera sp. GP187 TaxID=1882752 RepID=UPI00092A3F8D|nr:methyltransferase domain-containing protein [Singulisphaera sp. GP187]SIO32092.1 Methyltransferase domain-containing protein [Singulisphaera sp. GP187]
MKIGGHAGYSLLRWLKPGDKGQGSGETKLSYVPKIKRILGSEGWDDLRDKVVLDFGCGIGFGSVELAKHGAKHVIGIDIRRDVLEVARKYAEENGVSDACKFTESVDEKVDVVVSVDAFEHIGDPAAVLETMDSLLNDDGFVVISFGPTWYHPRGGHLFSIFPWSHLLFTEEAQIRWRSDFKDDGATRFHEVAGGLNRMTIKRFIKLVEQSPFKIDSFRAVPIRPLAWAHNRLTREFTSAIVECKLMKQGS